MGDGKTVKAIAEDTNLSKSKARQLLDDGVAEGLVEIVLRSGGFRFYRKIP